MKMPLFTRWVLGLVLFMALFAPFLANDRPLRCDIGGQAYYPALKGLFQSDNATLGHPALDSLDRGQLWPTLYPQHAIFAPVPFHPAHQSAAKRAKPFTPEPGRAARFVHVIGTDALGRDILAGMIGGARSAIWGSLLLMLFACLSGLVGGALAGYFGDDQLKVTYGRLTGLLVGILMAFFVAWPLSWMLTGEVDLNRTTGLIVLGVVGIFGAFSSVIEKRGAFWAKKLTLPVDLSIMRLAELTEIFPKIIALLAFSTLAGLRTLESLMILTGLMSWTTVARMIRAELLRIRALPYIDAVRNMGFSEWRILFRHALPNALNPLALLIPMGISESILLEAALSFLGVHTGKLNALSWGQLLHNARQYAEDWWSWLPPGILICLIALAMFEWSARLRGGR